jgi:hypothetical protein
MPRLVPFVLAMTLSISPAVAARPNATAMTCAQAAATVAQAGAVVMSTGQHTYERFVASAQYCVRHEITRPGYSPTRDSPRCQVGYVCETPDWLDR